MRHSSKGDYPHPKKTSTVQSVVRMTDGVCVDDGQSTHESVQYRVSLRISRTPVGLRQDWDFSNFLNFAKENGTATGCSRHRKG